MISTEAPQYEAFDIMKKKDSLIGRDFIVRNGGQEYSGPIEKVTVLTGGAVVIATAWQAARRIQNEADAPWGQLQDYPHGYNIDLKTSALKVDLKDDTVNIITSVWIGKVLPAGTPRLEKPER